LQNLHAPPVVRKRLKIKERFDPAEAHVLLVALAFEEKFKELSTRLQDLPSSAAYISHHPGQTNRFPKVLMEAELWIRSLWRRARAV
jgi:hypothetical protein